MKRILAKRKKNTGLYNSWIVWDYDSYDNWYCRSQNDKSHDEMTRIYAINPFTNHTVGTNLS